MICRNVAGNEAQGNASSANQLASAISQRSFRASCGAMSVAVRMATIITGSSFASLICSPLSGPQTIRVWTTKGTLNADQETQAGRDYRQQALMEEIIILAKQYGRYGYRRVTALLCHCLNEGSCIRLRPEYPWHVRTHDFVEGHTHDGSQVPYPDRGGQIITLRLIPPPGRYQGSW